MTKRGFKNCGVKARYYEEKMSRQERICALICTTCWVVIFISHSPSFCGGTLMTLFFFLLLLLLCYYDLVHLGFYVICLSWMNPYLSNETSVLILFSTLTLPHFLVELKKKNFLLKGSAYWVSMNRLPFSQQVLRIGTLCRIAISSIWVPLWFWIAAVQWGGAAEQRLQLSVRCVGMLLTSATEATTAERSLCNYVTRSSTASV